MIISLPKASFVDSPFVNNRFPLCFVDFCSDNALEREGLHALKLFGNGY